MKTSSSEQDAVFGQAMLTLRNTIALSRAELAKSLGVSPQTVRVWETGSSYPKLEHLKALITLAVKSKAFAKDSAAEEIRALWKTAHQKVLIDERWLSSLLSGQHHPHLRLVSPPENATMSNVTVMTRSVPRPRVDWDDALVIPVFYGREQELTLLSGWIVEERCQVVSVLGMGGIGKSALSVTTMHQLSRHFEVVIFRSLRDAPSCEVLLDDCLRILSLQSFSLVPATLEQRISSLMGHLRERRVLLVLDNLECLLQEGDVRGQFRVGYEGYGQLLQRIAETGHQSCLLFTSREKPAELRALASRSPCMRTLRLSGLSPFACKQLLEDREMAGTEAEQAQLIELYAGNPLALIIVAETIADLFGGEIGLFLDSNTPIFGDITGLLDTQFARLSAQEQMLLYWLAILREPVTLDELRAVLITPLPLLEAADSLRRRSLIELGKRTGSFTLQSVVLEYVTGVLIAEASREILQGRLERLRELALSQAKASEYVRQTQERLLVHPLLAELQRIYFGQSDVATGLAPVEKQLLSLLDQLRKQDHSTQGYGPANLITLLRLLRGDLSRLDLSQLSIRGAYLQGIEMHETSLRRSLLCDTIWTSAVSAVRSVAIAPSGKWWAAGGIQGKVRVWEEGGQTLQWIWQAHSDLVYSLAFSPDGRLLASGSRDGTIKLWDVKSGTLLWIAWQNTPASLAFSPDGKILASAGEDTTVRIWDPLNGTNVQTLAHSCQVYAVTFSPDGKILASGGFDGHIRLWETDAYTPIRTMQTSWVMSLAFSPDGSLLASGHWDRTVKLWEVKSLQLRHTLSEHTEQAKYVAWSPDGCILANCNKDKTIWLWDVEQGRYRTVLYGHSADINGMAFTPDSHRLLSCSEDGTLRVWDVERGHCVRVIAGYAVSLHDIAWSPDGTRLLSGGTDGRVSIWDISCRTPPRELHGHRWTVSGVGWSPDGRYLATCGWDGSMRLWEPASLSCIQKFEDRSTLLLSIAWSPDGSRLACGTYLQGMQVWDIAARRLCTVCQPHPNAFYSVAWSPDGTRLVGAGNDGIVYLWKGVNDTGQELCTVPTNLGAHPGRVTSVGWSPNGKLLASCSGSEGKGELLIWDVETARSVQTLGGHPGVVTTLAWGCSHGACPCGNLLVSGDSRGLVRWWDVERAACVNAQKGHFGNIQSLRVSPDGKRLASCGDDGTISIWDFASGTRLQTLRYDQPYERLNITGIRGLGEAEIDTLRALGAVEDDS